MIERYLKIVLAGFVKVDLCTSANMLDLYFLTKLIPFFVFQSLLDFTASMVLIASTVTVRDFEKVFHTGIIGWMECHLWKTEFIHYGLFLSSTWNIVTLTVERFVCFLG